MILGMSLSTFIAAHVIISLIGIASGIVVLVDMLTGKKSDGWIAFFLATTVLTSVTGYFFPAARILPSHIVGAISLVVLAIAIVALYFNHLKAAWRWIYIATAVIALYFNAFVGVVQAFQKLSFLAPLAPSQAGPAFVIAQMIVLTFFLAAGVVAGRRWPPA